MAIIELIIIMLLIAWVCKGSSRKSSRRCFSDFYSTLHPQDGIHEIIIREWIGKVLIQKKCVSMLAFWAE